MIPSFQYVSAKNREEALEALANLPKAVIMAGGTDLVIALQEGSLQPETVVGISQVDDLKGVKLSGNKVTIGSATTFTAVAESPVLRQYVPTLVEAALSVGSPQIRNRGTIGGNIINGSPAADVVPAFVALESEVTLQNKMGKRYLPLTDLLNGLKKGIITKNELMAEINFTLPGPNSRSCFVKLGRRNALAISRMSMALVVELEADGKISSASMSLGAVAPYPFRVIEAEAILKGSMPSPELFWEAARVVKRTVERVLGPRASAPYKIEAVQGVTLEALANLFPQILI